MASFDELMEQFRTPPEGGLPETFAEELQTAYADDLSVRDAAVSDRDQKLVDAANAKAASDAEVTRLKAVNYDLLVAAPKAGNPADNNKPDDTVEPSGIDSLFE